MAIWRPLFCSVKGPKRRDRKSTRLNSSHGYISYAVFCLKQKKNPGRHPHNPETIVVASDRSQHNVRILTLPMANPFLVSARTIVTQVTFLLLIGCSGVPL